MTLQIWNDLAVGVGLGAVVEAEGGVAEGSQTLG